MDERGIQLILRVHFAVELNNLGIRMGMHNRHPCKASLVMPKETVRLQTLA